MMRLLRPRYRDHYSDRLLDARRGEQLHPVQPPLRVSGGVSDPHLGEPRGHDVLAVARAVEPPLHDFFRGPRAERDVLADDLLPITDRPDPVCGGAAGEVLVLEVIVDRHVARVSERDAPEGVRERYGGRRGEGALTAARAAGARGVHELEG